MLNVLTGVAIFRVDVAFNVAGTNEGGSGLNVHSTDALHHLVLLAFGVRWTEGALHVPEVMRKEAQDVEVIQLDEPTHAGTEGARIAEDGS